jgi:hypothetical protein
MQASNVTKTARSYLLVPSDRPLEATAAMTRAPAPPDLCVKSPSDEARVTADLAFAGRYVRTIDEPLLAGRAETESVADFAWRCADALRALYALDTHSAFVVFDELPGIAETALLLDESSLLWIAERIERAVPPP